MVSDSEWRTTALDLPIYIHFGKNYISYSPSLQIDIVNEQTHVLGTYVLEGGAYGLQASLIDHRKGKTRGRLLTGIPPVLRCAYGRLRITYADDMTRMARVKPWISTLGTGRICQPRTLPTSKVSAEIPLRILLSFKDKFPISTLASSSLSVSWPSFCAL